jgi:acyl-CoA thioester hydrolase
MSIQFDLPRHALLADYPVWITLPVQWGEQDAFAHVNNTVYFRWYESARVEYGLRVKLDEWFEQKRIGPILAAISCNYRKQLTHPDSVQIGARVTRIGKSSLTMQHAVVSLLQNALAADCESTIVCFNYAENRPIPWPDELRAAVSTLENRTFSFLSPLS